MQCSVCFSIVAQIEIEQLSSLYMHISIRLYRNIYPTIQIIYTKQYLAIYTDGSPSVRIDSSLPIHTERWTFWSDFRPLSLRMQMDSPSMPIYRPFAGKPWKYSGYNTGQNRKCKSRNKGAGLEDTGLFFQVTPGAQPVHDLGAASAMRFLTPTCLFSDLSLSGMR